MTKKQIILIVVLLLFIPGGALAAFLIVGKKTLNNKIGTIQVGGAMSSILVLTKTGVDSFCTTYGITKDVFQELNPDITGTYISANTTVYIPAKIS